MALRPLYSHRSAVEWVWGGSFDLLNRIGFVSFFGNTMLYPFLSVSLILIPVHEESTSDDPSADTWGVYLVHSNFRVVAHS